MSAWITDTLAAPGLGRNKPAFLHVLFPVVIQSLAIYTAYKALRWNQAKRHAANQNVVSNPQIAPNQRNDPNKDREPGGMLQTSNPCIAAFGETNVSKTGF